MSHTAALRKGRTAGIIENLYCILTYSPVAVDAVGTRAVDGALVCPLTEARVPAVTAMRGAA